MAFVNCLDCSTESCPQGTGRSSAVTTFFPFLCHWTFEQPVGWTVTESLSFAVTPCSVYVASIVSATALEGPVESAVFGRAASLMEALSAPWSVGWVAATRGYVPTFQA